MFECRRGQWQWLNHMLWWALKLANAKIFAKRCRMMALTILSEIRYNHERKWNGRENIDSWRSLVERDGDTWKNGQVIQVREFSSQQEMFTGIKPQAMQVDIRTFPKKWKIARKREFRGGYCRFKNQFLWELWCLKIGGRETIPQCRNLYDYCEYWRKKFDRFKCFFGELVKFYFLGMSWCVISVWIKPRIAVRAVCRLM